MSRLDPVLVRGLSAIEPYLGDVVVAGGWVPHIYELLYDATAAGRSPRTRDIDLAVPRSIPVRGDSIDKLLTKAHFQCEFTSVSTPPVTKYRATDDDQEVEIEFITDAPGRSEAVIAVQPDLTAQELHYVGLLLVEPWTVDLGGITNGEANYSIRIPTPAAFVFHKSLVFKNRRDRVKAEKDLYYIFFVLESFPKWRGLIESGLGEFALSRPAWLKKCSRNLSALFDSADSAGVDAIVSQRPETAFPGLNDEQLRQYAFAVMSGLLAMMHAALADSA